MLLCSESYQVVMLPCSHYRHLGRNWVCFAFTCFCRYVIILPGLHEQTNRKYKNGTRDKTKDVLPKSNVGINTSTGNKREHECKHSVGRKRIQTSFCRQLVLAFLLPRFIRKCCLCMRLCRPFYPCLTIKKSDRAQLLKGNGKMSFLIQY